MTLIERKLGTMTKLAYLMFIMMISASTMAENWWEKIKLGGDLRYRHEMLKFEGGDARHRHRIRARLDVTAEVNPYTTIQIQMATGSGDPVSTNQTLDDDFSVKDFRLYIARFEYKPAQLKGFSLQAGKFPNPFYRAGKSELIWDVDLHPEGSAVVYTRSSGDINFDLRGAGLWINERSSEADTWLAGVQGIIGMTQADDRPGISVGLSYFLYGNVVGQEPFFESDEPMGNTVDEDGNYQYDYRLAEISFELAHKLGHLPVTFMADYVNNVAIGNDDQGWLAGVHLGKVKNQGSWAVRYIYRELKKDAVLGTFTDSDFRDGGTDGKGHEMGVDFQAADNTTLSLTYFNNTLGLDAAESGFQRLQADIQLKF